ncbi:MAG: hypothetical protein H0T53_04375 [Herpetosiphonaceae bacterium]|nr:hypothetical protein [Herpetosiphonaceae bacterium]
MRLTLHETRAQVYPTRCGIPWLGWVVYPTHRLLKRRCGIAFRRRYRMLTAAYRARRIGLKRLTASVQGWTAHVAHGNTVGLRRAIFEPPL